MARIYADNYFGKALAEILKPEPIRVNPRNPRLKFPERSGNYFRAMQNFYGKADRERVKHSFA
jgi:hypothetical protein